MCTVKKDMIIPEVSMSVDTPTPPPMPAKAPTSTDYDLINRQQSKLLLDMIYATKKPCFFSSKLPCPGTAAAAAASASAETKSLAEEVAKIKSTLADIQCQLKALPSAIVAALLENGLCHQIRVDVDDEEDADFDKLSSATTTPRMSTRTSMCSDIEVLNYCPSRPLCAGASHNTSPCASSRSNSNTPPPSIDISKEMLRLANSLKAIELTTRQWPTPVAPVQSPFVEETGAKDIASSMFSHWETRYGNNKTESDTVKPLAPMGNIRCSQNVNPVVVTPKILPYNAKIDLNVWLK